SRPSMLPGMYHSREKAMRNALRQAGIATTALVTMAGATVALPRPADARWGGGWHGGGWHGGGWHGGGWRGGGWGWGAAGLAIGTGLALAATAPYYGGYYADPYYYGYRPYA